MYKEKFMNAIIDMINDGLICQYCEEWIDGEAPGHKRTCGCDDCQRKMAFETNEKTKKCFLNNLKK